MPTARLLRPSSLTVEGIDKANTVYDELSREPIGNPARVNYTINAQRSNVHREVPSYIQQGVDEQIRGWFTILTADYEALGYTPRRGDRITQFGDWSTELYVVNTEPMGHWDEGPDLLRLYYADRRPAAAAPDKG